jgi:hypothetical protein
VRFDDSYGRCGIVADRGDAQNQPLLSIAGEGAVAAPAVAWNSPRPLPEAQPA